MSTVTTTWVRHQYDENDVGSSDELTVTADVEFEEQSRDCPGGYDVSLVSVVNEKGERVSLSFREEGDAIDAIVAECECIRREHQQHYRRGY